MLGKNGGGKASKRWQASLNLYVYTGYRVIRGSMGKEKAEKGRGQPEETANGTSRVKTRTRTVKGNGGGTERGKKGARQLQYLHRWGWGSKRT